MQVAPAPAIAKQIILVAVKASAGSADSVCIPIRWVLDELACPGDVVVVLAALHSSAFNLASDMFGYTIREKATIDSKSTMKKVQDRVERRRKEIEMVLSSLYVNFLQKKVKLYLDVRKGKIKALGIGHAMMLKATHIVLGRDLKIYKKHFVQHLPCTVIQMRRKSPPRTFQGLQSAISESNESDFDDLSSCSASQISTSERLSGIVHNHSLERNTELFSIEMAKQPLDSLAEKLERPLYDYETLAKLSGPVMISEGSSLFRPQQVTFSINDLAEAIRRLEAGQATGRCSVSCNSCSSIGNMGQALHYECSIASSASSRASSFRTFPLQCNNAESLSLQSHMQNLDNASSATKDSSPRIDFTKPLNLQWKMQKLDNTSSAAKDGSEIDPMEIQENVKEVISVQPCKAHGVLLDESLLLEEGLNFDDCLAFGQQKQYAAEYDSNKTFRHYDSGGDESNSRTPEERTIAESEVTEYVVSANSCPITLQPIDEHVFIGEEGRKSSALACPFCFVCNQSSINLSKRPIKFSHDQLSLATNGFSRENVLGGHDAGLVYKGMLKDGHHITIKKFKEPCVSEDDDRLFEIQLLMCAQHRNLMMFLGYCSEDSHFMLVYEYACNKSLSWHLAKEHNPDGLQWWARQKIAVGVARALRYLHEECRGGCIVHCDIKADNIFLTHEFVPMVGNFGLARLHQDKFDGDAVTSWRTDVYAFGVVLLELITGKQASDNSNSESQQHDLVDWALPLLLDGRYYELLDSRLESSHDSFELICMVRAALLCITDDPSSRPRMGQVMRILEGGNATNDEPRPMELALTDELSLMQCDKRDEVNLKPHNLQQDSSNVNMPRKKAKARPLTYDEMLH